MNKLQLQAGKYRLTIFLPDEHPDGIIYIPMHGDAGEAVKRLEDLRAAVVSVEGFDWNRDLSPWPAKAVFGNEDFGGEADAFLKDLTESILPAAERAMDIEPVWRGIAGYSLAGLFALYAVYKSSLFTRAASVSGSVWFDGWTDFAENRPFAAKVTHAYFSVGAKEKKTRNVRMQPVEENTRRMCELFRSRGAESIFVLNPGNHFVDADQRMADALDWLRQ